MNKRRYMLTCIFEELMTVVTDLNDKEVLKNIADLIVFSVDLSYLGTRNTVSDHSFSTTKS